MICRMNHSLDKTLARLGRELNRANIFWAVGGSVMLQQHGLVDQPQDIDILVAADDLHKAGEILNSLGDKIAEREEDDVFATDYFCEFNIEGITIDLISGLKIKKEGRIFEYNFTPETPRTFFTIDSEQIPFSTLEDWMIIYQWLPNKLEKAKIIKNHIAGTEPNI